MEGSLGTPMQDGLDRTREGLEREGRGVEYALVLRGGPQQARRDQATACSDKGV